MAMLLKITLVLLAAVMAVECGRHWNIIPGKLTQVTASVHYLWGVNRHRKIFMCQQPCTNGRWRSIPGSLAQIDTGEHEVWGVIYGRFYKRKVDGSGGWQHVQFNRKAMDVTASGHGYIYAIDRSFNVYKCRKPCGNNQFFKIANVPGGAIKIDAGFSNVYAINKDKKIYILSLHASRNARWRQIRGRLDSITVGGMSVYGVKGGKAYRCNDPCYNGRWRKVPMDFCLNNPKQIEASSTSLVAVDSRNLIFLKSLTREESLSKAVKGTNQIEEDKNEEEENAAGNGDEKKEEDKEGKKRNDKGNEDEKKEDEEGKDDDSIDTNEMETTLPYIEELENVDVNNEGEPDPDTP